MAEGASTRRGNRMTRPLLPPLYSRRPCRGESSSPSRLRPNSTSFRTCMRSYHKNMDRRGRAYVLLSPPSMPETVPRTTDFLPPNWCTGKSELRSADIKNVDRQKHVKLGRA
eukprot:6182312-Pleurochrysis_carterae.AAC.1